MSHMTQTLHVHGILRATLIDAITTRMKELGYARVRPKAPTPAHGDLRRVIVRRDRKWLTMVDAKGFSPSLYEAQVADADIAEWGEYLSRVLDRSVLTIWTWDGEASVGVTRWKRGRARGSLSLLDDAKRGGDGFAYAPAKAFAPWLPKADRDAILQRGIKLVTPSGGSTGDDEVDKLLEGFDDADRLSNEDDPDAPPYVSEGVSVRALTHAVGMDQPFLNPWVFDDGDQLKGDEELVFRRA